MRILLVADESAGARVLRDSLRRGFEVVGVVGSDGRDRANPVLGLARRSGLREFPGVAVKTAALATWIRKERVDVLVNVHSRHIITDAVINAPRLGAFNLHPGPLPEYAGLNPVSWAIFNGEPQHGVTVHRITPEIDGGDIVYLERFPVTCHDTALSLMMKCVEFGVPLVGRLLSACASSTALPRIRQESARRRYYGRAVPHDGRVSWKQSGEQIVRFVRACSFYPYPSPWGYPRARVKGCELSLGRVSLGPSHKGVEPGLVRIGSDGGIMVAAGDSWIVVERIVSEGRLVPPGSDTCQQLFR